MGKMLLVIDVQNDFINEITRGYVAKIQELIDSSRYEKVVFTKFINSIDSAWYKKLNFNGCMEEKGQAIPIETKENKVIEKTIYSAYNDELKKYISDNDIKQIYLCGFDTNACVQKTALDLFENGYEVFILSDYCMSSSSIELHNASINNLKILIGEDYII